MELIEAILLGLIQGLTEFLPVSSSGHLVILQSLFDYETHNIAFDVAVHLATLLSVLTVYRKTVFVLAKSPVDALKEKKLNDGLRVILLMFYASIPTAIIGFTFKDDFERMFNSLGAVGCFLLFTGGILLATRKSSGVLHKDQSIHQLVKEITPFKAVLVGFAQSIAIAPGVSRSGSTIAASLFLGASRDTAALFSFLISIPAILGASVLQLKDLDATNFEWMPFLVGFVVAYISGVAGLTLVLKFVKKGRLEVFSPYLFVVGLAAIYFGFFAS